MLSSAMGKDQELFNAVKSEDIQALTRLIAKNRTVKPKLLGTGKRININAQDIDGISCLHQAALMCSVPVMKVLLDGAACVDIKDNKGMRPLHYASWQGKPEPVSLLLQYNASVNETANKGETPLHLACQHGHIEVTKHLLHYHANPTIRNKEHKTALDVACEFGRYQVVELLLQSNRCRPLLDENPQDTADNDRTTCLHLAARNGHEDVIRLLLRSEVDINRSTLRGTALHEAAMHGKLDVVRMLIESGIDVNKPNSYDQTALDIVKSFTTCNAERQMKTLLKEIINAVQARAIRDYADLSDPDCLPLKEGEIVNVLEQRADGRWKGIVFLANHTSKSGYFPATAVQLLHRPVGGMQRIGTPKSSTIKKVAPPVVPEHTYRHSGSSFSSGYSSQAAVDRNSCGSLGTEEPVSPPPHSPSADTIDYTRQPSSYVAYNSPSTARHTPHFCFPDVQSQNLYTQVVIHPQPGSHPSTPVESTHTLTLPSSRHHPCNQAMLEDQGIDVCPSPGRESPSGSSGGSSASGGSRHSTSSVDSGRASGSDAKVGQYQLSLQGYESSHRHSYHSSSSSLGSVDRPEDSNSGVTSLGVNVAEMMLHGVQDAEILTAWLTSLRFEDYIHLFLQAGYDMPTISRMTPEDLTAIGITKPNHRRKLKAEIARLNISDGLPDYKPDSLLEWLHLLRLEEYYDTLCQQGYDTVDRVTELTWEDLEEIGIQKLGHQKKIMLAIKRVKDITNGIRRSSHIDSKDLSSGITTLPRPTNIGNVPSYPYHSQEVAITTTRAKMSPTTETANIPEFKTFQQSPPKGDGFHHFMARDLHSPTNSSSLYQPNVVAIQVRSSSRGRSLESLDMDDSVSTVMHPTFQSGPDCWYDTVSAWRQHGYDTDSELSVHNDHYLLYEADGTATLHRPKGMVKARPIAKIVAKTRQSDPEINTEPEEETKSLKLTSHNVDSWSPQHSWSVSTSPQVYGTLRGKRNPPPPPKRTNSIKSDPTVERSLEAMKDEAFATCVKGLTTHFSIATSRESDLPPPPNNQDRSVSPALTEDFPPPPSPLPSALPDFEGGAGDGRIEDSPCAKDTVQSDDVHANPKFRQRRKDSADSNISTSSTESNSLPFANENVGTIKQRMNKPHSSLAMDSSSPIASPSTLRKSSLPASPANARSVASSKWRESSGNERTQYGENASNGNCDELRRSSATSGDVIDDIENMLANLSNQLDAMLEDEISGQ